MWNMLNHHILQKANVWSQMSGHRSAHYGLPMKILIWPEHLELEGAPPIAVDPNSYVACCSQEGDLRHYHI